MTSQMMAFLTNILVIWSFLTGQAGDIGLRHDKGPKMIHKICLLNNPNR